MPLEEYKNSWILRKKKLFLIILYTQNFNCPLVWQFCSSKSLYKIEKMQERALKTTNVTHRPLDINFNQNNTTKYESNSLWSLGPHI